MDAAVAPRVDGVAPPFSEVGLLGTGGVELGNVALGPPALSTETRSSSLTLSSVRMPRNL